TFIEKTLCRPDVAFTLDINGKRTLTLEKTSSLRHRFVQSTQPLENESLFYETKHETHSDFSFSLIIGEPSIFRPTKKDIYIFVNGRRITEYSLVQAIEYGSTGYFPNGTYPVAALFVNIKPELVDFNIHPAKKEVRFQDISALHHEVSTAVKKFFFHYTEKNIKIKNQYQLPKPQYTPSKNITYKKNILVDDFSKIIMHSNPRYTSSKHFENNHSSTKFSIDDLTNEALDIKPTDCTPLSNDESNFTFVGIIFKTFILIQKNNLLYIIDQHAAHERYIFDSIINQKGKCQKLLLPYKIETSSASDDIYLSSIQASLLDFGFEFKKIKKGEWEVLSIHERWKGSKSDLENELLTSRVSPNEIIRKIAALTACRASVKAGDILDESTAIDIAKKAFSLKDPHCPHGRPVWTIITKDELFEKVKRT
ncbi:MAG: DNA mismatch repair protein MutL, partial [Treponema sp.]|nr:DNA mismatch repair protein MutL [Treponema sp.]